jgi:hypothetical protein
MVKKDPIERFAIGDIITVKETIECYYYNYPQGKNLVTFNPGDTAAILAFPPKVRNTEKDGSTCFVMFDAKGERFGTSWKNVVLVSKGEQNNG